MTALPPRPRSLALVWLFVALWLVTTSGRDVLAQDTKLLPERSVTEEKTGTGRLANYGYYPRESTSFFPSLHDEWGLHVYMHISQGILLFLVSAASNQQLRQICWRYPWLYICRRQPTQPPIWWGGWP